MRTTISTLDQPEAPLDRPRLRPPEDFCLLRGYRQQVVAFTHDQTPAEGAPEYWNPDRIAAAARYQHHVYAWAAELIVQRGLRSVLDVGCGPGIKLGRLIAPVCGDVEGIDQASGVEAARRAGSPGRYTIVDLDRPHRSVSPWRRFDVVICADVLEHLIDPDPAMELIRGFCHPGTVVMLSTPDRDRLRGRGCMESTKLEHVREWAASEFEAYITSRGFIVEQSRLFPADAAPIEDGADQERRFVSGDAETSPHRCHAVLCRVGSASGRE